MVPTLNLCSKKTLLYQATSFVAQASSGVSSMVMVMSSMAYLKISLSSQRTKVKYITSVLRAVISQLKAAPMVAPTIAASSKIHHHPHHQVKPHHHQMKPHLQVKPHHPCPMAFLRHSLLSSIAWMALPTPTTPLMISNTAV